MGEDPVGFLTRCTEQAKVFCVELSPRGAQRNGLQSRGFDLLEGRFLQDVHVDRNSIGVGKGKVHTRHLESVCAQDAFELVCAWHSRRLPLDVEDRPPPDKDDPVHSGCLRSSTAEL